MSLDQGFPWGCSQATEWGCSLMWRLTWRRGDAPASQPPQDMNLSSGTPPEQVTLETVQEGKWDGNPSLLKFNLEVTLHHIGSILLIRNHSLRPPTLKRKGLRTVSERQEAGLLFDHPWGCLPRPPLSRNSPAQKQNPSEFVYFLDFWRGTTSFFLFLTLRTY